MPVVVSSWIRVHGLPTVMVYLKWPLVAAICVPAASDCSSDVSEAVVAQLPSSVVAAGS